MEGNRFYVNESIILRNQPASSSTDYSPNDESSEHLKQEDKIWDLCLTITENPYDQNSEQTFK